MKPTDIARAIEAAFPTGQHPIKPKAPLKGHIDKLRETKPGNPFVGCPRDRTTVVVTVRQPDRPIFLPTPNACYEGTDGPIGRGGSWR